MIDFPRSELIEFNRLFEILFQLEENYTNGYFREDDHHLKEDESFLKNTYSRYEDMRASHKPDDARRFISESLWDYLVGPVEYYLQTESQGREMYRFLLDKLTPEVDPFISWLYSQESYKSAVLKFNQKQIATRRTMYWSGEYKNDTPNFSPKLRYDLPLISKELILAAITGEALSVYLDAKENPLCNRFAEPEQMNKASRTSSELLGIVQEQGRLDHLFGERVRELCSLLQQFVDNQEWKFEEYLISKRHPKAARELFINTFAELYPDELFFRDDRNPNSNLGPLALDYTRPHVDVITDIVSIIDPEITERRTHSSFKKYESWLEQKQKYDLMKDDDWVSQIIYRSNLK